MSEPDPTRRQVSPASQETQIALAELRQLPIADEIGAEHLSRLAEIATMEQVGTDAIVQAEGASVDTLRLVVSGRISLTLVKPQGDEAVVSTVSRGELIGWSSLLGAPPATLRARALKPTRCLAFAHHELLEAFEEDPELAYHLTRIALRVVAGRLYDAHVQLLDMFGRST